MGKMKEIFMDIMLKKYDEDYEAYVNDLTKHSCEKFIEDDAPCPNCFNISLMRNETNATCESCGQYFIYVNGSLRFE